jgi:hypothetical protein
VIRSQVRLTSKMKLSGQNLLSDVIDGQNLLSRCTMWKVKLLGYTLACNFFSCKLIDVETSVRPFEISLTCACPSVKSRVLVLLRSEFNDQIERPQSAISDY